MREIHSHTALRGIAAFLVVLTHYRIKLSPNINPDTFTSFFAKGYLWVDCFFMLSGFILCHVYGKALLDGKQDTLRSFFVARFARIYPLHLAVLVGLAIIAMVLHRESIGTPWTFALNVIDVHAWGLLSAFDWNFPSWSISVEFAAYLLFPVVWLALHRSPGIAAIAITVLICVSLYIGGQDSPHWERLALVHGLPLFFSGILIYLAPKLSHKEQLQIPAAALLIISMHFAWSDIIAELCFAALVYSLQDEAGPVARVVRAGPLLALGSWSYSIYMLHIPVRIMVDFALSGRISPFTQVLVMLVLTLVSGWASYRYFEMPMRRVLRFTSLRRASISPR